MKFDRPPAKRTGKEAELDRILKEYEDHFGEPYVFQIGFSLSVDEVTVEIRRLIESDTKQSLRGYDPEMVY